MYVCDTAYLPSTRGNVFNSVGAGEQREIHPEQNLPGGGFSRPQFYDLNFYTDSSMPVPSSRTLAVLGSS